MKTLLSSLLVFFFMMCGKQGFAIEYAVAVATPSVVALQPVVNYTTTYVPVVKQEIVWVPVQSQPMVLMPQPQWVPVYPWNNYQYGCWLRSRPFRY